jgi:hypothetical protein
MLMSICVLSARGFAPASLRSLSATMPRPAGRERDSVVSSILLICLAPFFCLTKPYDMGFCLVLHQNGPYDMGILQVLAM